MDKVGRQQAGEQMMSSRCILAAMLMMCAILSGCSSPGQRLLHVHIENDGKLILRTQFAVPDNWDNHAAWHELEKQSFEPAGTLTPDSAAPQQATLKGKVRLALVHAGAPFATANAEELRVVIDPAKTGHWRLAPGEMARTEKAMK
jgi:hypothetical protein